MKRSLSPMNKKGQLSALVPAILSLVIAAFILVMGIILTGSLSDIDDVGVTRLNETFSLVDNVTNTTANDASGCNFNGFTIIAATNWSREGAAPSGGITSANYTTFAADGNLIGSATMTIGLNGTDWLVNYTYAWGDEACRSGNLTVVGLGTFAEFWEIITLAVIIGVVLGLLLLIFGRRGPR